MTEKDHTFHRNNVAFRGLLELMSKTGEYNRYWYIVTSHILTRLQVPITHSRSVIIQNMCNDSVCYFSDGIPLVKTRRKVAGKSHYSDFDSYLKEVINSFTFDGRLTQTPTDENSSKM